MVTSLCLAAVIAAVGYGITPWAARRLRFEERVLIGVVLGAVTVSVATFLAFEIMGMGRPALALGHPSPDTELGAVVEGVGEALCHDGAALADDLGGPLGLALDEEGVGVGAGALSAGSPLRDPLTLRGGRDRGDAHVHLVSPSDAGMRSSSPAE